MPCSDPEIRMDDGALHDDLSEQNRSWDDSGTIISDTYLDVCVSSLRSGHANLLCIVPILTDDPRRESPAAPPGYHHNNNKKKKKKKKIFIRTYIHTYRKRHVSLPGEDIHTYIGIGKMEKQQ